MDELPHADRDPDAFIPHNCDCQDARPQVQATVFGLALKRQVEYDRPMSDYNSIC
jgi:hypothetical protein